MNPADGKITSIDILDIRKGIDPLITENLDEKVTNPTQTGQQVESPQNLSMLEKLSKLTINQNVHLPVIKQKYNTDINFQKISSINDRLIKEQMIHYPVISYDINKRLLKRTAYFVYLVLPKKS